MKKGNFFSSWKWKHTPRLHEYDRNDHKKHWFNLLAKRTVGFFQIRQKPKPSEAQKAFIFTSKIIHKPFGLWQEVLLCEKKSTFWKIEPYASLANFHTYSEASNSCASKVITRPITFKKSKIHKSQLLTKLRVNKS